MGKIQDQRQKEHSYLSKQHSQTAAHENDRAVRHSAFGKSILKIVDMNKTRDGDSETEKCLKAMAADQEALAKASGECAADHLTLSRFHAEKMDECAKATAEDELNKGTASDLLRRLEIVEGTIVPTRVAGVVPTAPGITAVPRAGQRSVGTERPNVPVQFEKLIAIEGD
jgi:hypothetical protein